MVFHQTSTPFSSHQIPEAAWNLSLKFTTITTIFYSDKWKIKHKWEVSHCTWWYEDRLGWILQTGITRIDCDRPMDWKIFGPFGDKKKVPLIEQFQSDHKVKKLKNGIVSYQETIPLIVVTWEWAPLFTASCRLDEDGNEFFCKKFYPFISG